MYKKLCLLVLIVLSAAVIGCGKKENAPTTEGKSKTTFQYSESITASDIPDIPVKGFIGGKPVEIIYINFETWRGSNDNVINFSTKQPKQPCGNVVNDTAFSLTRLAKDFNQGEFIKSSFTSNIDGYIGNYHTYKEDEARKFSGSWNCALILTEINDNTVKGKIAMCFKDSLKSWIAGTFEAKRCNN
ncbi:MAG TPA: hypothetical protein PK447_07535 [Ignavibacteria bacterium]|nr:hypothetical protein [Ignavibacteria bacterium]